jgi:ABC-type transport system involved in multi-copper enzyme maturation permease subunit
MSGQGLKLWRRQAWVLARQEAVRSVFSRRSLPVLLLIGMPLSLAVMRAIFLPVSFRVDPAHTTAEFAQMFYFFMLRFIVFFACALLFVKLFRGEILERSLHYTLLAPLRREVLVVGKYLGGLLSALLILLPTTALTLALFYLPHGGEGLRYFSSGPGIGHLASYLLVVLLACMAYGALFTLAGLFFRNPMVPAILFLGWEVATPFLPPFLKVIGIVHYLGSLTPVPPAMGPLALLAQPVEPWLAVAALAAAVIVLLAACSWKAKRLEVTYSAE